MKSITATTYKIEIGSLINSSFETVVKENYANSKVVILVDSNTSEHCLEYLITNFDFLRNAEVMLLPGGEENKVMEICFQVWQAMSDYQIGRQDLMINLGGGIVTDMGGFIASIYKRGIDFINIPTSLLAMVDASIGGKTGVDLGLLKNQLGVFSNPKALFVDPSFLATLPDREIVNGFAEMLKHALIKDKSLWKRFSELDDLDELKDETLIQRSILIKNEVVLADPLEEGARKILNFGHTAGHAIEGFFLDQGQLDHGYCVAMGMIVESYISMKRGMISKEIFDEIEDVILDWFELVTIENSDIPGIIELMHNDKKNHSGKIQCCLLRGIGECVYDKPVSRDEFTDAFLYLANHNVHLN